MQNRNDTGDTAMNTRNGHRLPALCGQVLSLRAAKEDGYDPWMDPSYSGKPGKGRKTRPRNQRRNSITVSVDLCSPLGGTSRETEMCMSLNTQSTRALLKNPYLVQQFLESSLRTYRPSGPVRHLKR